MSRGLGLLMRMIVERLTEAENSTMTRAQIEDQFVPLGFRSDNILRAIRTLDRLHVLRLREGRFAETSRVRLFRPVENPIPDDELLAILRRLE
jgi:hypothetical protein